MLFTDEDLAERCRLAKFGIGWHLGRLDGRQDVLAYLHLAHRAGLAFVTFDPGRTMRLFKIGEIVARLMDGRTGRESIRCASPKCVAHPKYVAKPKLPAKRMEGCYFVREADVAALVKDVDVRLDPLVQEMLNSREREEAVHAGLVAAGIR